jgi:hypothetical protein
MLSNVTRYGLLISSLLALSCGGSEFQSNDTADASAGSGGSSGSAGTGGTGETGGTGGSSGAAGTGGTATGGTAGVGGTGGSSGTGTGGVAGTDGGPGCDTECAPLPPPGWDGPATLLSVPTDENPPSCEGYFDQPAVLALEGISWDPPSCFCECSTDTSKAILDSFSGVNCTASPCGTTTLQNGNCTGSPSTCTGVVGKLRVTMPPGTCSSTVAATMNEVNVENSATVCVGAPPSPSGCGDNEYCEVDAPGPRCVFRAGELPCPDGPYDKQHVIYQNFVDERTCTDCACGLEGSAGNLEVYGGNSCGTLLSEYSVPSDCLTGPTTTNGLSFRFTTESTIAVCQPITATSPVNTVVLDGPMTVCCR